MARMQKEDIEHLATLARIELSEEEIAKLGEEFTAILGYVEQLNDILADAEEEKEVGLHYNVLREDTDPHEPGIYTEKLLDAAPKRDGAYISVKKILKDDQ